MDKGKIIDAVRPAVTARGCFLVDAAVTKDNEVTLTIERETGTVEMEDCVAIDRAFHDLFDQDMEDYALTVTSAGLDQPFKVLRQYEKAVGTRVEVSLRGGRKFTAELVSATEDAVRVRYTTLEKVEGQKKKAAVEHDETLPMAEVNAVRPHIDFE